MAKKQAEKKEHLIVVLSDGETWEVVELGATLCKVSDSQLKKLKAGYEPKHLKLKETVSLLELFNLACCHCYKELKRLTEKSK